MTTLEKLRRHPRVEIVDDERSIGNSIIVTLKQGWTFTPNDDNRVSGEDTPTAMLTAVKMQYHMPDHTFPDSTGLSTLINYMRIKNDRPT